MKKILLIACICALSACGTNGSSNPFGDAVVNMINPSIRERQDAAAAAERQANALQKAASERQEVEYRDAVHALVTRAASQGYVNTRFDDLILDAKQLSGIGAKVLVYGSYFKFGYSEVLMKPQFIQANHDFASLPKIGLLTEEASRKSRQMLLSCQQTESWDTYVGCRVALLGRVTFCTMLSLEGSEKIPCLRVDDGWN